jgi:alcohol dehydrogenase class IV
MGSMDSTSSFSYFAPTRLTVGRGAVASIPEFLASHGHGKGLVVTDQGLVSAGLVDRITSTLDSAEMSYAIYDQVQENPPIEVVEACLDKYLSEECDYLLAVGGGSSMDTAKTAGVLVTNEGRISDFFGPGKVTNQIPFTLCVPTTYGTASEVTPFAVVTDQNHYKASVVSPNIIPQIGILDSEMAVALPMPIAAATGMDALTHAIESYVALTSNPVSEGLALHAIRLISKYLRQAASSNSNHPATEQMLIASTLAGMAFSQSRLGNVHAMSHPVSGHFGVPHGVANAVLLPRVMNYNKIACPEKFAEIATAMGEDITGYSAVEGAECAIDAVVQLAEDVKIPASLSAAGVDPQGIPTLAEDAMKSPNTLVNPRSTTLEDVSQIYEEAI